MNISDLVKQNPEIVENLTVKLNLTDLTAYAEYCFSKARQDLPDPKPKEELLTPAQFADTLKISLVTLWNWDNKGITKPVRIGNAKRYRRSDLDKLINS